MSHLNHGWDDPLRPPDESDDRNPMLSHYVRPLLQRHTFIFLMEPHGQARGPQKPYPTTPMGADTIRCASINASSGHPPGSETRRRMVRVSPESSHPELG